MGYVSGFLLAVPEANKADYAKVAGETWEMFADYGALSTRECLGVDVPDGEVTSFPMAVKLEEGEAVVFAWVEWPDRATGDAGFASMQEDPRMEAFMEMPFDAKRMMWGGFEVLVAREA